MLSRVACAPFQKTTALRFKLRFYSISGIVTMSKTDHAERTAAEPRDPVSNFTVN